eukprot:9467481-Pyramimonas_sp.AAC.1
MARRRSTTRDTARLQLDEDLADVFSSPFCTVQIQETMKLLGRHGTAVGKRGLTRTFGTKPTDVSIFLAAVDQ